MGARSMSAARATDCDVEHRAVYARRSPTITRIDRPTSGRPFFAASPRSRGGPRVPRRVCLWAGGSVVRRPKGRTVATDEFDDLATLVVKQCDALEALVRPVWQDMTDLDEHSGELARTLERLVGRTCDRLS